MYVLVVAEVFECTDKVGMYSKYTVGLWYVRLIMFRIIRIVNLAGVQ